MLIRKGSTFLIFQLNSLNKDYNKKKQFRPVAVSTPLELEDSSSIYNSDGSSTKLNEHHRHI
jgi:hypothetical protein